jgi:hypothetical protein
MKLRLYAVLVSVAALGLVVALLREQAASRELAERVTKLTRLNADLRYDFKQTARQAAEVGQRAAELDSQLGSTKARTTATEVKQIQLTRELTETKTRLTDREQREIALMAELATLRQKVAEAAIAPTPVAAPTAPVVTPASPPTVVATVSAPVEPPPPAIDVAAYDRRIAELEQQLTQLLTRALADAVEAPAAEPTPAPVAPPAPPAYQVVRVGPRDSFVVLDYGTEQGARLNDIIRLRRGTLEVARVQISDARPRFSLAQVLPGTLKGQLQSGDLVVFKN